MKRIIICGCGADYWEDRDEIKQLEQEGMIQVVGVSDRKFPEGSIFDGYMVIRRDMIAEYSFDNILVLSAVYGKEIKSELIRMGVAPQALEYELPSRYIDRSYNGISIFSNNCWGGFAAHTLGIRFCSPTVNLWIADQDFLRFLENLKYYLSLEPVMTGWSGARSCYDMERYPMLSVGDITLQCNHDTDPDVAIEKWQRRKQRVNYDNMIAVFITDVPSLEKKFYRIEGIDKKYCLIPWEDPDPHSVRIPKREKIPWRETAIGTGKPGRGLDLGAIMRGSDNVVIEERLYR